VALLVILPGTDGTGALLNEFVSALGDLPTTVIVYPKDRALGYEQLVEFVLPQLPASEPYFLLGESFGGPLAISLARAHQGPLAGVVLCASFARYPVLLPRALAPLAVFAPTRIVPISIISWFLLGKWSTPGRQASLAHTLASVSPAVLRARLLAALRVDVSSYLPELKVPLLYLQASHDRIVPLSAGNAVISAAPRASLQQVVGPHFLLQAAPVLCAQAVRRFAGF
jgi:pimeloyl-[acyl-carrier protein] methyl ester esterase